jgi:hypothetical protein
MRQARRTPTPGLFYFLASSVLVTHDSPLTTASATFVILSEAKDLSATSQASIPHPW